MVRKRNTKRISQGSPPLSIRNHNNNSLMTNKSHSCADGVQNYYITREYEKKKTFLFSQFFATLSVSTSTGVCSVLKTLERLSANEQSRKTENYVLEKILRDNKRDSAVAAKSIGHDQSTGRTRARRKCATAITEENRLVFLR